MLAKTITYTDYNGEERTETFYFNLSKTEVALMQLEHPGGYSDYLKRIVESKDQKEIVKTFKQLIKDSYGIKSDDGHYFRKSEEAYRDFEATEAYSELIVQLLTNGEETAAFINGIMPVQDLEESKKAELAAKTKQLIDTAKSNFDTN